MTTKEAHDRALVEIMIVTNKYSCDLVLIDNSLCIVSDGVFTEIMKGTEKDGMIYLPQLFDNKKG